MTDSDTEYRLSSASSSRSVAVEGLRRKAIAASRVFKSPSPKYSPEYHSSSSAASMLPPPAAPSVQ